MRLLASSLALGGLMLAGGAMAQTGDAEAGRKVAGMCRTCHGLDGIARVPIAPHIAGEPVPYLARQLQAFRDGTREHEMMTVVASGLSDQQIADLAAWYGAQAVTAEAVTPPPEVAASCLDCHGEAGLATLEDAPHLAGETNIYIETQLKAYQSGKRSHEIMTEVAAGLSPGEMREIATWFASIRIAVE